MSDNSRNISDTLNSHVPTNPNHNVPTNPQLTSAFLKDLNKVPHAHNSIKSTLKESPQKSILVLQT